MILEKFFVFLIKLLPVDSNLCLHYRKIALKFIKSFILSKFVNLSCSIIDCNWCLIKIYHSDRIYHESIYYSDLDNEVCSFYST